jgi:hypothetical protein
MNSKRRNGSFIYLRRAGILAVLMLLYMSQARGCAHQEPAPIQISPAS